MKNLQLFISKNRNNTSEKTDNYYFKKAILVIDWERIC